MTFYMTMVEGGTLPSKRHDTFSAATTEAARLSAKTNQRVYVLKAVESCAPVTPVVEWRSEGDK